MNYESILDLIIYSASFLIVYLMILLSLRVIIIERIVAVKMTLRVTEIIATNEKNIKILEDVLYEAGMFEIRRLKKKQKIKSISVLKTLAKRKDIRDLLYDDEELLTMLDVVNLHTLLKKAENWIKKAIYLLLFVGFSVSFGIGMLDARHNRGI